MRSPRSKRLFDVSGIEKVGLRVDVDENWSGADRHDGDHGRDEGVRSRDDLVTRTDAERSEGEFKRRRPAVDANRALRVAIRRELLFELGDVLAEHAEGPAA